MTLLLVEQAAFTTASREIATTAEAARPKDEEDLIVLLLKGELYRL